MHKLLLIDMYIWVLSKSLEMCQMDIGLPYVDLGLGLWKAQVRRALRLAGIGL